MASFPAAAIVNMESLHLGQPEDGWSGRFELGASGATGNTEKWDAAAGLRLQRQEGVNTSFLVLDYAYARSLGQTNADKSFAHLRNIYQYNDDIAYEGFLQVAQNKFTRLGYRRLAGGGLRYTLTEQSPLRAWFLGLGAFYEREQLIDPALNEDEIDKAWRGNVYLVMKHQFSNQTRLLSSTYYQPKLSSTDNFRILEQAGLSVSLAEKLSLQLSINVSYDSEPPLGVRKTDTGYRTGISYQF
jgi:putative salt-induced outer membrane protein